MPKRFTATEKWDDPWFRSLSPKMKCGWDFITSKCDIIGVWKIDVPAVAFYVGEPITIDEMIKTFNNGKERIRILSLEKLYIIEFVAFQYGDISKSKHPFHEQIRTLCDRVSIEYRQGIDTPKEKEEDKDKEEVKEEEEEKKPLNTTGVVTTQPGPAPIDAAEKKRIREEGLKNRTDVFQNEVAAFSEQYPADMLEKFFGYWSEPNRSRTKMKFEMQETWELSRRLTTWASRDRSPRQYGRQEVSKETLIENMKKFRAQRDAREAQ